MPMDLTEFDVFDESNVEFMDAVAETLSSTVISEIFQDQLVVVNSNAKSCTLNLSIKPVHKLNSKLLNSCLTLVDQNLSAHYSRQNGKEWKLEKREEMLQDGLIYIFYKDEDSGNIVAFLSFMLTYYEPEEKINKVLYLFEIHVSKSYQSLRIGAELIERFHLVAKRLHELKDDDLLSVDATCLTVFSNNTKALKWYEALNYKVTEDSPKDKVLRNKKVIKPPYYILTRTL
ncbi:putative N-alpha-acetyltransferase 40 [[Candida] railenensis]|uniref:N-alpha-acetyltransferase 40 n=1 Tax=[Candida] railenensis TaxID=45579 RepID=A0A9P0VXF1_9ASCO|nr:putative N-alpha-acetyltransferase 40 [[Candida] railenensis]